MTTDRELKPNLSPGSLSRSLRPSRMAPVWGWPSPEKSSKGTEVRLLLKAWQGRVRLLLSGCRWFRKSDHEPVKGAGSAAAVPSGQTAAPRSVCVCTYQPNNPFSFLAVSMAVSAGLSAGSLFAFEVSERSASNALASAGQYSASS